MKRLLKNAFPILSLGTGLAIALLLLAKISFELSYDGCYDESAQIYKISSHIQMGSNDPKDFGQTSGGVAPAFAEGIPQIEAATRGTFVVESDINRDEDGNVLKGVIYAVDDQFFKVFRWPVLEGDPEDALAKWNACVMVSRSFAEKLGGIHDAIGKTLVNQSLPDIKFIVKGVFENFPENSSFGDFDILCSIACMGDWSISNWFGNDRYRSYVRLAPGTDSESLADPMRSIQEANQNKDELQAAGVDMYYTLKSLKNAHVKDKEVRSRILILGTIAILLLLISVMNYVLVAIGDVLRRSKEVGVRKCYGASEVSIYALLFKETAAKVALAVGVAAMLVYAMRSSVEQLLGVSVNGLLVPRTFWILASVVLLVFAVCAFVPSRMFTKIPVASAFRNYKENKRRWKLALLGVQFTMNAVLLALLLIVSAQYRMAINEDTGYDYENIAYSRIDGVSNMERATLAQELKNLPCVEGAELAYDLPLGVSSGDNVMFPGEDRQIFNAADQYEATPGFFDLMGFRILEGRRPELPTDVAVSKSFEENVRKYRDFPNGIVGEQFEITGHTATSFTVCGVYENYRIGSLMDSDSRPSMRFAAGTDSTSNAYMSVLCVKLNELNQSTMKEINVKLEEMMPNKNLEFVSYAESVKESYSDIYKTKRTFMLGSFVAILIAIFGLVGYVRDENYRRSKEVAVRKVNGAVSVEIVGMMVTDILKISIPTIIVGDIAAWFIADMFLSLFSERVGLGPSYFLIADLIVLAVVVATVVWGSYRIAHSNPVESLKNE